jgi:hypothetical protein
MQSGSIFGYPKYDYNPYIIIKDYSLIIHNAHTFLLVCVLADTNIIAVKLF